MSFKAAEGKGREGDKGKGKGQDRPQAVGARGGVLGRKLGGELDRARAGPQVSQIKKIQRKGCNERRCVNW